MDALIDLASRLFPHGLDVWSVAAGALVLAVVQRILQGRPGKGYDAWWLFNVDPASVKAPLPPSRPPLEPIMPTPRLPPQLTPGLGTLIAQAESDQVDLVLPGGLGEPPAFVEPRAPTPRPSLPH